MSRFGEVLDRHRRTRGLNRQQLADAAHLSAGYVGLLINGSKTTPSIEVVEALAVALKLDQDQTEELRGTLENLPRPLATSGRRSTVSQYAGIDPSLAGIVSVHATLPNGIVERHIGEAKERIRIQDTWIADPRRFTTAFLRASENGVHTQLLLLDPESPYAIQRSKDLQSQSESDVPEEVRETIKQCKYLHREGVLLEVKLYRSLPSIPQIICDGHMFIGFFLHGERSDFTYQLEIEGTDSALYTIFEQDFNRTWDTAIPVHLDNSDA